MSENGKLRPLSGPQKNIWYMEQYHPDTSIAVISATMRLKASTDFVLLERAINLLIRDNDAMRLRIRTVDGEPRQYVSDYAWNSLAFQDFSTMDRQALYDWDTRMSQTPLYKEDAPLYRFVMLRIDADTCGYFVQLHHLIADAWTLTIVGDEIMRYYLALQGGEEPEDRPRPSFLEYLDEEAAWLSSERLQKDIAFWDDQFASCPEPAVIRPRTSASVTTRADRKNFRLPLKLCDKIREHAALSGASVFATFLGAFLMYIHRTTAGDDILIGVPVLNRTNARAKSTPGMFVTTVPLRARIDAEDSCIDFTRALTGKWMKILRHQRCPMDEIRKAFQARTGDARRLYDIVFSFQNARFERYEESFNLDSRWHFCGHQNESLSIHVNDRDGDGIILVSYDYLVDLFDEEEIDALHDHYIRLLWHSLDNPARRMRDVHMVSEREQRLILCEFNDTRKDFPDDWTMLSFFEARVRSAPDRTAVLCGEKRLTYGELDMCAEHLARHLRVRGVGPDSVVAVMLYRSFEMLTAILAVWKAGGAYLPIDPDSPDQRIGFILRDSEAALLLSVGGIRPLPDCPAERLDIDALPDDAPETEAVCAGPENLSYIIYTSGSTGTPKGVMIEHRALVNRISWMNRQYPLSEDDVILQKTPWTFDVSVWELAWWFYAGAQMAFLPPGDEKHPERIADAVALYHITAMHFVPSMLGAFLDYVDARGDAWKLRGLRHVFASGEALPAAQVHRFYRLMRGADTPRLHNLYGPTEAAIDVTYYDCMDTPDLTVVPIGKPIDNIRILILDRYGNLLPTGIPGELHIGGTGLARGYRNRPDLTAERFIPDPFHPGERLYRTGDLARWLPDGEIEFLGRMDHQVKIRGFRIEPAEIERCLEQCGSVKRAVVMPGEGSGGERILIAWYTAHAPADAGALRGHLLQSLPDYMVPAVFIRVSEIPLTSSGKVNHRMLPAPEGPRHSPAASVRERVLPRSRMEARVMEIWSDILGRDDLSVTDNFFDMGGDSISAINMVCRMPGKVGVAGLYENPVLEDFARCCLQTGDRRFLTLLSGREDAETAYILCPYGGGGAWVYADLAARLAEDDPDCAVWSVSLPGHDFAGEDEEYLSVRDVAALIFRESAARVQGKIVIYAHCVGAALGIELARLFELAGTRVEALCAGGIIPPAGVDFYGWFFDPWAFFTDERVLRILEALGLSTGGLGAEGRAALLRAFRHDVRAWYRYLSTFVRQGFRKLETPVHVVLGEQDRLTGAAPNVRGWNLIAGRIADATILSGAGHYFPETHSAELARLLRSAVHSEVRECV